MWSPVEAGGTNRESFNSLAARRAAIKVSAAISPPK
jgi:hypothetical protein